MKILITITKGDVGGAQMAVFSMAKGLQERGHNIVVGIGEGEFLKKKLEKENIPVHIFKNLKRTRTLPRNISFICEIKKYLDKEDFDIVHFNSSNALLGAIGAKISKNKAKTVFTFHGLSILDPNHRSSIFYIFYWTIFKFLLYFIDKKIFVSFNNLERAKKINIVKDGEVTYNSLIKSSIDFDDRKQTLKLFEDKINIPLGNSYILGSIGRISIEKNFEFLIKIFPEILKIEPRAICIIIGGGIEIPRLKNLITDLNLESKIFLTGEIEEASRYLKLFDINILPSLYEGLSISLIETIHARVPSIASNVGGNKEIIGENFTYELNNKIKFLELFTKIHNKDLKQDFKEKEVLFEEKSMIDKLENIYK